MKIAVTFYCGDSYIVKNFFAVLKIVTINIFIPKQDCNFLNVAEKVSPLTFKLFFRFI